MESDITAKQRTISKKYYAYKVFSNLWFQGAIWLYFYRLFITDQQVGIMDAAAFSIGLLAEVPSGALADRFGRKRIAQLGQLMVGSAFFIQAFAGSFIPFFVGQIIMMVGAAFVSGADQALFFESLNFNKASVHWRKLITRGGQITLIATLLATVIGGWLYGVGPKIPWILTGASFMVSALLLSTIREDRRTTTRETFKNDIIKYTRNIKAGFRAFGSPRLSLYIPIILSVQGLFYTADWGILRITLLDRFHFSPFLGAVAIAASGIMTIGILSLLHRYAERLTEKLVLTTISLAAAASLLLATANIGIWGYIVILALYAGNYILEPFMSEVVNNSVGNDERATALSVASFLKNLPYIFLAPIIGYANTHNTLEYFLVSWGLVICLSTTAYLLLKKKHVSVRISEESIIV